MKNLNKHRLKIFIILVVLFLGINISARAQTNVCDPILKSLEETSDKLKRTEIERDSTKAQLDIANQRIELKNEEVANKEEQVQFYKKASEKGDEIDTKTSLIIQNLRQQVSDDRIEIERLRAENKSLRSSRDFRTIFGFGAGLATGYFLKK